LIKESLFRLHIIEILSLKRSECMRIITVKIATPLLIRSKAAKVTAELGIWSPKEISRGETIHLVTLLAQRYLPHTSTETRRLLSPKHPFPTVRYTGSTD